MKIAYRLIPLGLAALVFSASGCSLNPDSSRDFRASVDSMHLRQADNPSAAEQPVGTVKPADGGATARVVDSYRETATAKSDSVSTEVTINVGN
jgi:hypothetical protein